VEWAKLVHVSASLATGALARLHLHETWLSPELARLYITLVREGAAVARAEGVELDDGPVRFPVRQVVSQPADAALELVQEQGRRLERAGGTRVRTSMLQSIERGRRLEHEDTQGFVVREGARLGVPVPAMNVCYQLLAAIDQRLA
jgi:ketopantoate reductase